MVSRFCTAGGSIETVIGGSTNETVTKVAKKVGDLKQNRARFCFRVRAFSKFKMAVSRIRPKIRVEAFKWVTS